MCTDPVATGSARENPPEMAGMSNGSTLALSMLAKPKLATTMLSSSFCMLDPAMAELATQASNSVVSRYGLARDIALSAIEKAPSHSGPVPLPVG